MSEKKWVVCTNCMAELELSELGYFMNDENNGVSAFCGNCGWIEFIASDEFEADKESEEILENGPSEYYDYPKKIVQMPDDFYVARHYKRKLKEDEE